MVKEGSIASDLLKELLKKRMIGGSYKPIEKVIRFFPSNDRQAVKKVIKKLISKGILFSFKSGNCISINNKRLSEISKIIEGNMLD